MPHFVYLARCSDGSLYAGTCLDLKQREEMHNSGKGAKYTRGRGPVKMIYHETYETLGEARSREAAVKKLQKADKEMLAASTKRRKKTVRAGGSERKRAAR